MHPCDWSLLPSTVPDVFVSPWCAFHHMHLSISEKPESATHPSTSTASTGLLCLLVGALVHFIFSRSHKLMHVAATTTQCWSHPSQLLASLGGCQLKPHSLKHECKPASVVTQVCKCSCRKVSREKCPLIPMGLPVVLGTGMQLAWHISC